MRYFYAIVLLLLALSYFLYDSGKTGKKDISIKTDSYINGLKVIGKKDGTDSWVLVAEKAVLTRDETMAEMDTVTVTLIKDAISVNADTGSFNMLSNDLSLNKNIKIHTNKSVISANNLAWNPADGTLTTDAGIKMEGAKFQIEGGAMTATQDHKVKLKDRVKATFY